MCIRDRNIYISTYIHVYITLWVELIKCQPYVVPYLIMGESIWRNQYHKKDRFYNILIKATIIQNFRIYCQLAHMGPPICSNIFSKYVQGPNHFNVNEFFATHTYELAPKSRYVTFYIPYDMAHMIWYIAYISIRLYGSNRYRNELQWLIV